MVNTLHTQLDIEFDFKIMKNHGFQKENETKNWKNEWFLQLSQGFIYQISFDLDGKI
jgi:hypothetical protein